MAAGAVVNYLTKYSVVTGSGQIINSSAFDNGSVFQIQNSQLLFLRNNSFSGNCFAIQDQAGTLTLFAVNQAGDLSIIQSVAYHWPVAQGAAGTFLRNDGSGGLTWVTATGASGITMGSPATLNYMPRWSSVTAPGTLIDSGISDDGTLVTFAGSRWILAGSDGTINIGDHYDVGPKNRFRFNAIYLKSGLFVFPRGTSTSSPTTCGFIALNASTAGATTEATQFFFYGARNMFQSGDQVRTVLASYYGLELRGGRLNTAGPSFVTGANSDPCVSVIPEVTGNVALMMKPASGVALTNSLLELWHSAADSSAAFSVGPNGGAVIVTNTTSAIPLTMSCPSGANQSLIIGTVGGSQKFKVNFAGSVWSEGGLRHKVALIQPASGATVDVGANYMDYHVLILDTLNGSFTLLLPLLNATNDGTMFRIILNRRTSTATVTVKSQTGNDINETTSGATTGWAMHPNTNDTRDALIVGDNQTSEWWLANLRV
jgi:hypothetical protein